MILPFAGVLVPEQSGDLPKDALGDWSNGRRDSISADNAITAQLDEDPALQIPGFDNFTYFPVIAVPVVGLSSVPSYSSVPYQPGFNSIYLPGYTYRPNILVLGLGLGPTGLRPPGLGTTGWRPPGLGASGFGPPGLGTT